VRCPPQASNGRGTEEEECGSGCFGRPSNLRSLRGQYRLDGRSDAFLDKPPIPAARLVPRRSEVAQQPVYRQPTRWRCLSNDRPLAAPGPLLRRIAHPRPHRVSGRHPAYPRADTRPDRPTEPVVARHHLCRKAQEALPMLVILEDRLAPVATGGAVIQGARKLGAQGSGHARGLTEPLIGVS